MRTKALTVDELELINRTSSHQAKRIEDTLAKAAWIAGDGARERRLAEQECKGCHYGSYLAGQAFTGWKCRFCETAGRHPNTAVPKLCLDCAKAFDLCTSCGGDINMAFRTKKFGRKAKKS